MSFKTLVLKLGGQCNLNCKHCHCMKLSFSFNEDILNYIKKENFSRITFCGGEPLLYFDIIKKIVEYIGDICNYKLVTNSTLLDKDKVKFFNKYNFHIGASYDGANNSRDNKYINKFYLLSEIKSNSLVTLFNKDNQDYDKLSFDVNSMKYKYNIYNPKGRFWMNFVHQTQLNPNSDINKDFAVKYCQILCNNLETEFLSLKNKKSEIKECPILNMGFNKWVRKNNFRGIKCMNEKVIVMNISGQFMLCPYTDKFVGDIYTGVDWKKVESYIPQKCKECNLWESCHNQCIENITDNECFINKVMNKHFYKLMDKYSYSYEYLATHIKE